MVDGDESLMDSALIDVQETWRCMNGQAAVQKVGTRLFLVGTIHVDPASRSLAKETVRNVKPEVVALEIDSERLDALNDPSKARPSMSGGPSFFAMALLEKFAGQLTGSSPGLEMLEAARAARSVGARIELIDRPINTTVSGLKKLPLGEKVRIGVDGLASIAFLPFGRIDVSTLTEGIDDQLHLFRSRYPKLSKLLLDDREQYMTKRLKSIMDQSVGQVVAVVGSGHVAALSKALEGYREKAGYTTSLTWTLGAN